MSFFGGVKQMPTKSKGQMNFLGQLLNNLGVGPLGQGFGQGIDYWTKILSGEPGAFEAYEAPLKREFNEQIIPGLAERFSGMGAGAQNSSAFQQSLGQAGAGLTEKLAQLRAGLQGQAAQGLAGSFGNLANLGLGTNTFQNVEQQGWGGPSVEMLLALLPFLL